MNAAAPEKTALPRRKRQRTDRRRYLLEAAETVFAEHGFHEASMEQVTKAADATGTIYLCLKSEEKFSTALIEGAARTCTLSFSQNQFS